MSHFNEAVYSKLQNIPLSFFRRKPSMFTDSEMDQSLKKGILLLSDFLSESLPPGVAIRTAAEKIKSAPQRFIDYYEYYSAPITLPFEASDNETLGELTERFIQEYRERLELKNGFLRSNPGERISSDTIEENNRTIDIFSKLYDARGRDVYSREELGKIYGQTVERTRQIIEAEIISPCRNILNGQENDDRIVAAEPLLKKYEDISGTGIEPLEVFVNKMGECRPKTLVFLTDILGLTLYDSSNYFEPFILNTRKISDINRNEGKVVKFFIDQVLPIPEAKLKLKLASCKDDETRRVILDLVKKSDRFEVFENVGEKYYALKWPYLEYLPNEVVRILHDAGRSMHRDELLVEYNKRARQFGKVEFTENNFHFGRHKLLVAKGKTGYWSLKNDDDVSQRRDVRDEIRDYVCNQGGKVTLDNVCAHTSELGYKQKPGCIKTYLAKRCLRVIDEPATYVYEDWADRFPDLRLLSRHWNAPEAVKMIVEILSSKQNYRMPVPDLGRELSFRSGRNVLPTSLRSYLNVVDGLFDIDNPEELGIKIKGAGKGRTQIVTLNREVADGLDYDKIGKAPEPEYRQLIRNQAIEELRSVKGNKMPLSDLTKKVKALVPDHIKDSIVYKILGDDSLFAKEGDGRNKLISLNAEKFKIEEAPSYKFAVETTEAPQVPDEKLEIDSSSQTFDWAILRDEIVFQTKSFFAPFDFDVEKATDGLYELMAGRKGLVRSSAWWDILNMLNNYWLHKTAQYERELLSNKLSVKFEKLLIDGYISKFDENPKIYDGVNGLGGLVKLLQQKSLLPEFNMPYSRGNIRCKISDILSKVVNTRNKYVHPSNDERAREREINDNIMNCLILYLYAAKQYTKTN